MLGSLYRTETSDEQKLTEPGMAYFAGTGPFGKTCKDCKFKGYSRAGRENYDSTINDWVSRIYRTGGCAKFLALTGEHGPPIKGALRACKYFEPKKP